jgi:hypothetical protein
MATTTAARQAATTAGPRRTTRDRYLDVMDDLAAGKHRDLVYTVIAVLLIVLLGSIIVPLTISRNPALPTVGDADRLASRYLTEVAKVKGFTPPADAASVVRQFGTDGGEGCSTSLPDLVKSTVVTPKPQPGHRGASHVSQTKLQALQAALRVYCPKRNDQLTAYMQR